MHVPITKASDIPNIIKFYEWRNDGQKRKDIAFNKSISKDYLEPLAYARSNAEVEAVLRSLPYLPMKAPFDMMDNCWA